MGAVEVEGSAAEEDAGFRLGDLEVTDVFADFGVVAAEEGAVVGEGVDEVEDVDGVLELGFADGGSAYPGAGGLGAGRVADWQQRGGGGHLPRLILACARRALAALRASATRGREVPPRTSWQSRVASRVMAA